MKNKARIAYDPTTTIFVVVYGVSGHQNDVESSVGIEFILSKIIQSFLKPLLI